MKLPSARLLEIGAGARSKQCDDRVEGFEHSFRLFCITTAALLLKFIRRLVATNPGVRTKEGQEEIIVKQYQSITRSKMIRFALPIL
jgi:hypothetical protein